MLLSLSHYDETLVSFASLPYLEKFRYQWVYVANHWHQSYTWLILHDQIGCMCMLIWLLLVLFKCLYAIGNPVITIEILDGVWSSSCQYFELRSIHVPLKQLKHFTALLWVIDLSSELDCANWSCHFSAYWGEVHSFFMCGYNNVLKQLKQSIAFLWINNSSFQGFSVECSPHSWMIFVLTSSHDCIYISLSIICCFLSISE